MTTNNENTQYINGRHEETVGRHASETTPLLGSQTVQKTSYVTFAGQINDDSWTPPRGFWWIETGR
jgi:hypothetical protein